MIERIVDIRKRLVPVSGVRSPGTIAVLLAVGLLLFYQFLNPQFWTAFQLQNLSNLIAPLVLVSLAQLLIVMAGGIDVSAGSVLSLCNVVAVSVASEYGALAGFAAAVGVGVLTGVVNVAINVKFHVDVIVVTLGTAFIFGSVAVLVQDRPGGNVPGDMLAVTSSLLGGVLPAAFLWIFLPTIGIHLMLTRTVFGRGIVGVGSNAQGVLAAGMSAGAVRMGAGAASGALIGMSSFVLAGTNATADPRVGVPYLLLAIAAVALGGADFAGGRGSAAGTCAAAVVLSLISSLMFWVGITSYWQFVVISIVIIGASSAPFIIRHLRSAGERRTS